MGNSGNMILPILVMTEIQKYNNQCLAVKLNLATLFTHLILVFKQEQYV